MQLQASLPEGASALPNNLGTALGFSCELDGCQIYALPGVPSEMRAMFTAHVLPKLKMQRGLSGEVVITCRFIGMTESTLDQQVLSWHQDLGDLKDKVRLGMQARFPELLVYLYTQPEFEDSVREKSSLLTDNHHQFVDYSASPAATVIHDLLIERNLSLGLAESCSGGYISSLLAAGEGASKYLKGSFVSYSNQMKIDVLGVSEKTMNESGAVSSACALEMAVGTRQALGSDIAVATTGILGPSGGTCDKPVGTAFVGMVWPGGQHAQHFQLKRDRLLGREELAVNTLFLLEKFIKSLEHTHREQT
jgi:nicotinamide-nucleotide amidase